MDRDTLEAQDKYLRLAKTHKKLKTTHKDIVKRHSKALTALVEIERVCRNEYVGGTTETKGLASKIMRAVEESKTKPRRVKRANTGPQPEPLSG